MGVQNQDINVAVVKYRDRKNLLLAYTDPRSGKRVTRSAGTSNRRAAERAAAKMEEELREGRYKKPTKQVGKSFASAMSVRRRKSLPRQP
jgi:hypothetical protein